MLKRSLAALLLVFLPVAPLLADTCNTGSPVVMVPMPGEAITVSNTAIGFTAAKISIAGTGTAIMAVCAVESNAIRTRDDATDPTAGVGTAWAVGDKFFVCGKVAVSQFKAIRQSADATLFCIYYRGE